MASRQFDHHQETSLQRLRGFIPGACPLLVERCSYGFRAYTLDGKDRVEGRYQLVAYWIEGYVAAWRRVALRRGPGEPALDTPKTPAT